MDPLRLTLISQNLLSAAAAANTATRSSFHQSYLNPSNYLHHYLTNIQPVCVDNNSTSPNDDSSNSDKSNTYDKLHQQQRTQTNLIRPQAIIPLVKPGGGGNQPATVFNTLNPNFLNCTSTLSAQNRLNHLANREFVCSNGSSLETTPFLIIRSPNNNLNLLEENCFNPIAGSSSFRMSESVVQQHDDQDAQQQHTYHEIGDVLVGGNGSNMTRLNQQTNETARNEMYI